MCVKWPDPPIPTLGGGLSIPGIPAPSPFDLALCCKLYTFTIAPFPPVPILAANASVITAALEALKAYYRAIGPKCPKNS